MRFIVDTNVPKTANGEASPQASSICVRICVVRLSEIQQRHTLVLDDRWLIIKEYIGQLRSSGQPGVGDAFLKWVLTNQANPTRCECIPITPTEDGSSFVEFPQDPALSGFDPSDHKFVVVALAHTEAPIPILNAVDTDWWHYRVALASNGVEVDFLCPEVMSDI